MILHLWLPYLDFGFYRCDFHILTLDFTIALPISWHWVSPHDFHVLIMMNDLSAWLEWWMALWHLYLYADIALCTSHWWIVTLWSHFMHLASCTRFGFDLDCLSTHYMHFVLWRLEALLLMIVIFAFYLDLMMWILVNDFVVMVCIDLAVSAAMPIYLCDLSPLSARCIASFTPCISVIALDTWCHSMWVHAFVLSILNLHVAFTMDCRLTLYPPCALCS